MVLKHPSSGLARHQPVGLWTELEVVHKADACSFPVTVFADVDNSFFNLEQAVHYIS